MTTKKSEAELLGRGGSKYNKKTVTRQKTNLEESGNNEDPAYLTEAPDQGDADTDQVDVQKSQKATTQEDFGGIDIYDDKAYDTDLEAEDGPGAFDHTGREAYREACKMFDVIPASYFLRHMQDDTLDMRFHNLGDNGIKPICMSLVSNSTLTHLNFGDNWITPTGGTTLCEMLKENCFITTVELANNRLGLDFARSLVEVLLVNETITSLNLSGNLFDDKSGEYFADIITNNQKLLKLDLSRNKFSEECGKIFGLAIGENSTMQELDLSWNTLRGRAAIEISKNGIKTNVMLKKLNLSNNGFGAEPAGCRALGDALKANAVLEELDVSCNRITAEGAVLIGKGLTVNESLQVLKIGKNMMQSAGCYGIVQALVKNPNNKIEHLDFSETFCNPDFWDVYNQLKNAVQEAGRTLTLKHGAEEVKLKPKKKIHPMVKLKNYIEKRNMRMLDFFNEFDEDGSMSVSREEFSDGIRAHKIPLTEEEMEFLLNELDRDGDGEINYSELVIGQQEHEQKGRRQPIR